MNCLRYQSVQSALHIFSWKIPPWEFGIWLMARFLDHGLMDVTLYNENFSGMSFSIENHDAKCRLNGMFSFFDSFSFIFIPSELRFVSWLDKAKHIPDIPMKPIMWKNSHQSFHRQSEYHDSDRVILVGGFNPFDKYARQIGSFLQVRVKIKNLWNHHP